MRRLNAFLVVLLLLASSACAPEIRKPAAKDRSGGEAVSRTARYGSDADFGKGVLDIWEAAYLPGGKAGYFHTTVQEGRRGDQSILRTTMEMNLTLKRFQDNVTLRMETGTDETPDGKVTGVFMRQYQGKEQKLELVGTVSGRQLHLAASGTGALQPAPWDDRVVGLYRQRRLFQERKVKPGDAFSFLSFEPAVNLVVTLRVSVKDREQVAVPGSKSKRRLLRAEVRADEIRITRPDGKVDRYQPPMVTYWLDDDLIPVRSQMELPGLGLITTYQTTREAAQSPDGRATTTDMGLSQLVRLNRRIPAPYETRSAVYRITVAGDADAASAFAQDGRQQVEKARGETFELHVHASRGPAAKEGDARAGDEYLKSCYFINCADDRVKRHARAAVGDETDPWRKALRIEKWVHGHMRVTFDEALATADHVARTLEGDCTEHAMLAAAMCRAEGIPSRTAVGLIYVDHKLRGPVLGFHMWTEVLVRGQWVPIDATLGRGHVGATHLKVGDQSWHGDRTMTPLLPFVRVVGKLKVEVVSVNERK